MTLSEEKAHEKFTLKYYVRDSHSDTPQKDLIWCLNFATEAHKNQKRKDLDKTPYINHPIGVAYILSEEAGLTNVDLLRGCLLHDTVEDTSVVSEMVRAKFGDFIGNLVDEVTDDKTLPKQKRKDLQRFESGGRGRPPPQDPVSQYRLHVGKVCSPALIRGQNLPELPEGKNKFS